MKKIFAILLSLALMLSLAVPAMADGETTYSITIDNTATGHTYEAYQIFTGDLSGQANPDAVTGTNAKLSNIQWGSNIDRAKFIQALNAAQITNLATNASAATVAEKLVGKDAAKIAECAAASLTGAAAGSDDYDESKYEISGLAPGYYLVKEAGAALTGHDAKTRYIIEVVENSTVTPKAVKPTVDKQVQDEVGDKDVNSTDNEEGWGETADHAINENFQFKLIATLAADENFDAYETYKVVFNDRMSAGITFVEINSVTVNGTNVTSYNETASTANDKAGLTWSLTIADIKPYVGANDTTITIEVIYTAKLNENAKVGNVDDNKNTVDLQYSNNPNVSGGGTTEELGKTPEDTVWVFTYEMKNTKIDGGTKNALAGATFAIKNNEGKYYGGVVNGVVTWVASTDPVKDNNVYKVTSNAEGDFTVKGLDVGTYILTEIVTPAGYNTCADVTVVITANHSEKNATKAEATIVMTKDTVAATEITVENNAGTTLPETGGMGTTIFYVVGGVMVAAAAILLITKKRMSAEG